MHRQIILSLEGLTVDALSCYGSSWNHTPGFDSIAADGVAWDRVICHHDDPEKVLRTVINDCLGVDWLLTDAMTDPAEVEGLKEDVTADSMESYASRSSPDAPAPTVEDSHFFALTQHFIDRVRATSDFRRLWLHSDFLTRHWDAPRDLFPIDDEFIEEPIEGAEFDAVAERADEIEICESILAVTQPPQHECGAGDSVDLVTTWMRTYGCQVRLIDRLLDDLVDLAEECEAALVVFGTSGFALGQNGRIGHRAGPLRSCHLSVPLIIRCPSDDSQWGPVRWRDPLSTKKIGALLKDSLRSIDAKEPLIDPADWARDHDDEYEPLIESHSTKASVCLNTRGWFFVRDRDGTDHLHLKPDDRHDENNVDRLRPDVTQRLEEAWKDVG